MSKDAPHPNSGHLEYYEEHSISPVHYRMEDVESHFGRRDSLYRTLGLPPVAFRGARVLEIAPGSGQNSLYVAVLQKDRKRLVGTAPGLFLRVARGEL